MTTLPLSNGDRQKEKNEMNTEQIEQFRKEFKSIVYQNSEILANTKHLGKLHAWDKNGSHESAILKALDVRKKLKADLSIMLKGKDYEEWRLFSKRLAILTSRHKTGSGVMTNAQTEINSLTF